MLIVDNGGGAGLESLPGWITASGPTINQVAPTSFFEQEFNGGPLEEYITAPAYGGALASLARPIPVIDGSPLSYVEHSYQRKFSAAALQFIRNFETDWIGVWPGAPNSSTPGPINKANGSLQHAIYRSGMWQLTPGNAWTDTGFSSTPPAADMYQKVTVRYNVDWVGQTITPILLIDGNQSCSSFPSGMNKMPFLNSNWTRGTISGGGSNQGVYVVQFQLDNNAVSSAFMVSIQGVCVRWCDNPNFS